MRYPHSDGVRWSALPYVGCEDARLNTVMNKLTGWAAIIAVPTAITGFYGQNVPYPGFGTISGFLASTSVMLILMVVLYVMFRRRDWL